ncbi:recombinase family protein [Bengtsoniella intestinalis]|uniref:recombinase family protein n=1 Tax=Bengtsoniella intestinalis TaxID=3073143 RepID=UPI00391F7A16
MNQNKQLRVAGYARLSREDGDRLESDSILSQQRLIEDYCSHHPEFQLVDYYPDDGYTGTNFNRPSFQKMLGDIEHGDIDCVICKDLSRFGRDYIDMGHYLERYFPSHGVRFIAINDGVDSLSGPYDMLLPLKNVFNTQYAKDISGKVRSAFAVKQRRGEFVGAFASYGYLKDPQHRNKLIVDPVASQVVQRIYEMAANGMGQIRIALVLNEEGVPCPSQYKRLMGERYHNGKRLDTTHYWTYATIHRILDNEMYLGNMVQGRSIRPTMHAKAKANDREQWTVVPNTHEPIISQALWNTVQAQIRSHTKATDFKHNVGIFAGFLRCGDCGRAMAKATWSGRTHYTCGSYRRYGKDICTKHYIPHTDLEELILSDLNQIIASVGDLKQLAEENRKPASPQQDSGNKRLEAALDRVLRLKKAAYEDYQDNLITREDFKRYQQEYNQQEESLNQQLGQLAHVATQENPLDAPWVDALLQHGCLTQLDRATVAQTIEVIRIFEDNRVEITYRFSAELGLLLDSMNTEKEGNTHV